MNTIQTGEDSIIDEIHNTWERLAELYHYVLVTYSQAAKDLHLSAPKLHRIKATAIGKKIEFERLTSAWQLEASRHVSCNPNLSSLFRLDINGIMSMPPFTNRSQQLICGKTQMSIQN